MKKIKYIWVTLAPMLFVTVTTLTAAFQMITYHYWSKAATPVMIQINISLIWVMVVCSFIIFFGALRRSLLLARSG